MGDPVSIGPESRAKVRELAAAIVESVEMDIEMPLDMPTVHVHGAGQMVHPCLSG